MQMVLQNFSCLQNELEVISRTWSFDFLDCLRYIYDNRKEYSGTQCWKEFVEFTETVGLLTGK